MIKEQARKALHGNFTKLIAGAGLTTVVFLLIEYANYIVLHLTGAADVESGKVLNEIPYMIDSAILFSIMIFVSPLFSGFLRMAADTAVKKDCAVTDMFYYFRSAPAYFKTVAINLIVLLMFSIPASALDPSRYIEIFAPDLGDEPYGAVVLLLSGFIGLIIKFFIYMIFVHFQLAAHALHDDWSVKRCVFAMLLFAFKNFGKLLRLMLSFAGWFALCFFVAPAIYVIPYFAVASMTSARWLFELEKAGDNP